MIHQKDKQKPERCVIITAHHAVFPFDPREIREKDVIYCADGGYLAAQEAGLIPQLLIGDFDSLTASDLAKTLPPSCEVIRLVPEKDDTDTMMCLKEGLGRGFHQFLIIGGLSGRLDHTMANLQTLAYATEAGALLRIIDGPNEATMLRNSAINITRREGWKVSLFSFSSVCQGVSISGVKYPLKQAVLHNSFPLGVSNEFVEKEATIEVQEGQLLIILSQD